MLVGCKSICRTELDVVGMQIIEKKRNSKGFEHVYERFDRR